MEKKDVMIKKSFYIDRLHVAYIKKYITKNQCTESEVARIAFDKFIQAADDKSKDLEAIENAIRILQAIVKNHKK